MFMCKNLIFDGDNNKYEMVIFVLGKTNLSGKDDTPNL